MRLYQIAITFVAFAAETWLLLCIVRYRRWRSLPYFATFLAWDWLTTAIGLFLIWKFASYRHLWQIFSMGFVILLACSGIEAIERHSSTQCPVIVNALGCVGLLFALWYIEQPAHQKYFLEPIYFCRAFIALIMAVRIFYSVRILRRIDAHSAILLAFCTANAISYLALVVGSRRGVTGSAVLTAEFACWLAWSWSLALKTTFPHSSHFSYSPRQS